MAIYFINLNELMLNDVLNHLNDANTKSIQITMKLDAKQSF